MKKKQIYGSIGRFFQRGAVMLAVLLAVALFPDASAEALDMSVKADVPGYESYLQYSWANSKGANYGSVSDWANNQITINNKRGGAYDPTTTTLTLYNKLDYPVKVTFSVSNSTTPPGNSPIEIAGAGSVNFNVATKWGVVSYSKETSGTLTITGAEIVETSCNTTFRAGVGGSYTVTHADHSSISVDGTTAYPSAPTKAYSLVPTVNSGYTFYGWADSSGLLSLSKGSNGAYLYYGGADNTIWPVFWKNGSALYYIEGAPGVFYNYLDDANAAASAGSNKKIVAVESGVIQSFAGSSSIEISSGVTLVLPYAKGQTEITDSRKSDNDFPYANYAEQSPYTNADLNPDTGKYLELTLPAGVTLTNKGIIAIGGTVDGRSAHGYAGVCNGAHSNLKVNGTLQMMGSTSVLSVVGYITTDGGGSVTTEGSSGSKIYQLFSVLDYFDGGYTALCAGHTGDSSLNPNYEQDTVTGESLIVPFNRFAALGIRASVTVTSGNNMYGYADLFAGEKHNKTTACAIGESGLIQLTEGASVTATYDKSQYVSRSGTYYSNIGRTTLDVTGGVNLGSLTLKTNAGLMTIDVDTANMVFNIPYNFDIVLRNGNYTIGQNATLLPGCSLTVGEGASLTINGTSGVPIRFAVYDGLQDQRRMLYDNTNNAAAITTPNGDCANRGYPTTAELQAASFGGNGAANLIVDGGTLTIGQYVIFGGIVQTTAAEGSKLTVSAESFDPTMQFGAIGNEWILTATWHAAGASVTTVNARIANAKGEQIAMKTGTFIPLAEPKTTTTVSAKYTLYPNSNDYSSNYSGAEEETITLNATVQGAWKCENCSYDEEITTAATCTTAGVKTYACSVCGHTYTEEIPAGHRWNKETGVCDGGCGLAAYVDGGIGATTILCADNEQHNFTLDVTDWYVERYNDPDNGVYVGFKATLTGDSYVVEQIDKIGFDIGTSQFRDGKAVWEAGDNNTYTYTYLMKTEEETLHTASAVVEFKNAIYTSRSVSFKAKDHPTPTA